MHEKFPTATLKTFDRNIFQLYLKFCIKCMNLQALLIRSSTAIIRFLLTSSQSDKVQKLPTKEAKTWER